MYSSLRLSLAASLRRAASALTFTGLTVLSAVPLHAQGSDTFVTTREELADALRQVEPGDTVTMANGQWTDTIIALSRDGVEGDSIRLRAETPGRVILNGRSTLDIGGDYNVVEGLRFEGGALSGGHVIEFRSSAGGAANHSRLTNSAVIDYNPASRSTEYKWVSLYGTYNRVDHSYFAGKTNAGATMVVWLEDPPNAEPNYHRIDHNYFGRRPPLGENGGETIRIGTSTRSMQDSFTTVEYNLFERCDGEIETISNKSGRNTYRSNTFLSTKGSLTLRHGNGARVEGNFFIGNRLPDTGGIRVIGEDHVIVNNYLENLRGNGFRSALSLVNGVPNSPLNRYFQVKNALIAFNTIVGSTSPIVYGAGRDSERTLPPEDVTFANNVFVSEGGAVIRDDEPTTDVTWAGNVVFGGDLGIDPVAGVTVTDPQFETGADGLQRPGAGSPLLDAAAPLATDTTALDMDGQPREAGLYDIGADERSDAPATRGVLRPGDPGLGPTWLASVANEPAADAPPKTRLHLGAPFPNPTAGSLTVDLVLGTAEQVTVRAYDVLGREVATLLDRALPAGTHPVTWAADGLAPGLYVVVARTADVSARRAVTVVRR